MDTYSDQMAQIRIEKAAGVLARACLRIAKEHNLIKSPVASLPKE